MLTEWKGASGALVTGGKARGPLVWAAWAEETLRRGRHEIWWLDGETTGPPAGKFADGLAGKKSMASRRTLVARGNLAKAGEAAAGKIFRVHERKKKDLRIDPADQQTQDSGQLRAKSCRQVENAAVCWDMVGSEIAPLCGAL